MPLVRDPDTGFLTGPPGMKRARSGKRAHPEDDLHKAINSWLQICLLPAAHQWAVENRNLGAWEGARRKLRGVKAGVWDIQIIYRGVPHWIEVKAGKNDLTDDQKEFRRRLVECGVPASHFTVCRSICDVADALLRWCIPARTNWVGA